MTSANQSGERKEMLERRVVGRSHISLGRGCCKKVTGSPCALDADSAQKPKFTGGAARRESLRRYLRESELYLKGKIFSTVQFDEHIKKSDLAHARLK